MSVGLCVSCVVSGASCGDAEFTHVHRPRWLPRCVSSLFVFSVSVLCPFWLRGWVGGFSLSFALYSGVYDIPLFADLCRSASLDLNPGPPPIVAQVRRP